jgi:hypothetical protein
MTNPIDILPASDPLAYAAAPEGRLLEAEAEAFDQHQEINERRARVENTELLEQLRGL